MSFRTRWFRRRTKQKRELENILPGWSRPPEASMIRTPPQWTIIVNSQRLPTGIRLDVCSFLSNWLRAKKPTPITGITLLESRSSTDAECIRFLAKQHFFWMTAVLTTTATPHENRGGQLSWQAGSIWFGRSSPRASETFLLLRNSWEILPKRNADTSLYMRSRANNASDRWVSRVCVCYFLHGSIHECVISFGSF